MEVARGSWRIKDGGGGSYLFRLPIWTLKYKAHVLHTEKKKKKKKKFKRRTVVGKFNLTLNILCYFHDKYRDQLQ